ncbi:MAG: methylenetetrahydrofolate--tRNA-(uracil(54)-C(5))-methyltransferase (FADH(2)-oxidizing) TrmFO [Myxococcales bacterium]|nr:methylenetetrahydrofolate--tRNA-(uracil(54)-C(5))-methyltransferase (FADH(2)-oxidizing) TrmFO [Myxococcales bacterium]
MFQPDVTIIGGGLAGCEAAWQLAERGVRVALVEMKPAQQSPAHTTPLLAELVCSNSLRSDEITAPAGLLKAELRACRSFIIACADEARVPAGEALAVDRRLFSQLCTVRIARHPFIRLERRRVDRLPEGPAILAGGPLLAGGAAHELQRLCGERLYFYDAIAPIVDADSIDWSCCFRASRHDRSGGDGAEGDYVNCPLTREEYYRLVEEIRRGRKVLPHPFEEPRYFEGCLPIEVMVERGADTLAFGPLRPVGLIDPRNPSEPPFAVVQLRAENRYGTAYNLVGFQTRLAYPEQKRIFSLIPALRQAEWLRFGSIHRNSYVESWRVLDTELALRSKPSLHLAGQITGVEGYIESTAMGLLAAWFVHGKLTGRPLPPPPETTALGGLYQHVIRPRQPGERYVPMNINFGLLPPLPGRTRKTERRALMAQRAQRALQAWLAELGTGRTQPARSQSLSAASTAAP